MENPCSKVANPRDAGVQRSVRSPREELGSVWRFAWDAAVGGTPLQFR